MLAVPTIAMGGTLPAAARAATRDSDVRRQDLAAVYALNTLGAVVGCIVATFWLLEIFGTHNTIWLAAAVNGAIASVAMVIGRVFGDVRSDEVQQRGGPAKAGHQRETHERWIVPAVQKPDRCASGSAIADRPEAVRHEPDQAAPRQAPGTRPHRRTRHSSTRHPSTWHSTRHPARRTRHPSGSCSSPPPPSASRSS